ncbi:substrate-binding periplasmic protein [Algicola sagamiensis]|uniref:substrate-binding periplasmic protein n=1 Tax=Algicola sagamiensis TaxID=163869 RepID=UPI0003822099|nr:transporter substrate-binding domain-containing protein [Algicola sagamiensis]
MRLLLISFLLFTFPLFATQKIEIVTGEWAPFSGKKLPEKGLVLQIIREAYRQQGVTAEFFFTPWARAMQFATSGKTIASAFWVKSAEREKTVIYSDPVFLSTAHFFYLKKVRFHWKQPTDLYGKNIGIGRGYYYGDTLEDLEKKQRIQVTRTTHETDLFQLLIQNQLDLVITEVNIGRYMLQNQMRSKMRGLVDAHPTPFYISELHVVYSRKRHESTMFLKQLNQGLKAIQESGRYQAIIDTYMNGALRGKIDSNLKKE